MTTESLPSALMPSTSSSEMGLIDRYMQAVGNSSLLSAEEEVTLAVLVKKGDKAARDKMILSNLRLVVKIAYDYAGMGVPLVDLISEGNIGLIKSVDRFDPTRGGRLATYAAWWIRQMIKKALADQGKTMRLPMHVVEKIAKLRRATNDLTAELEREPTIEEVAAETGYSERRINQLKNLLANSVSLEAPSGHFSMPLEEVLGDEEADDPLTTLLKKTNVERIDQILESMDARHAAILRLRHGIENGGSSPRTLDKVGVILGLTRERVRQLEQEAQTQLRRILSTDEEPLSKEQVVEEARERSRAETLHQFMVEKGIARRAG